MQSGVNDLEAGVAERAGDHFRAAIVPIQAGLRDQDADLTIGHSTPAVRTAFRRGKVMVTSPPAQRLTAAPSIMRRAAPTRPRHMAAVASACHRDQAFVPV